jgi:uncharacterized membrane protein YccC
LIQTFLVVVVWPLRRFAIERRSLAGAYRTLAAYTLTIPAQDALPPEPHTFAGTASPLADPQPFATSGQPFIFQGLLDEAERIRASLAALTIRYPRLEAADQRAAKALIDVLSDALAELAAALDEGRAPREPPGFSQTLAGDIGPLSSDTLVEPLLGQIRAAWRTAGMLTADSEHLAPRRELVAARRRRVAIRDGFITLRANLSTRSTACRHALRLAVVLALAAVIARTFELPRGYWLPLTIALVLKPDFHDTFTFTTARVAGTVLGAAGATAIGVLFAPSPVALIVLVLVFVWAAYGFGVANYGAFSACITAYVVFLMTLAGIPEVTAATDRILYTVLAGALAACAYVAWPTWTATEARPALAAMLEAQSGYVSSLLSAYADPSHVDLRKLHEIRASARLARSNSEATVERMLGEPRSRYTINPRTAVGVVGATRRNALAALSLHAGLERDHLPGVPDIRELASGVGSSLSMLAYAVRQRAAPRSLPQLRQMQRDLGHAHDVIRDETDLIVDSVETIAELLVNDAALSQTGEQRGSPPSATSA